MKDPAPESGKRPMENNDYLMEFHSGLTAAVEREISRQREKMLWGGTDLSRAIFNYEWYRHLSLRSDYINRRKNGIKGGLDELRIDFKADRLGHEKDVLRDAESHPWRGPMESVGGRVLIFADNLRHLEYLKPLTEALTERGNKTVVLTRSAILPDMKGHGTMTVIKYRHIISRAALTSGLLERYNELALFAHTLYCMMLWMRPSVMICCDGCQTQYQMAALYCGSLGIPAVCMQFGWPGFIHAGFSKLPYSDFLMWGNRFGEIMGQYSETTRFRSTGRLGEADDRGRHSKITFFLQAPVFVSTEEYRREFGELILATADRLMDREIAIREHPEYEDGKFMKEIMMRSNITADKNTTAGESLRESLVGVSHFSSCLTEAPIFGCEPVVFNPTRGFRYELCDDEHTGKDVESCLRIIERMARGENQRRAANHIEACGPEATERAIEALNSLEERIKK